MHRIRPSSFAFVAAYLALVAGLFLALGGAAYAQTSAGDQYGDEDKVAGVIVEETTGTPPAETPSGEVAGTTSETLPNTGRSLLVVALVGGGLVSLGIALRRRERPQDGR